MKILLTFIFLIIPSLSYGFGGMVIGGGNYTDTSITETGEMPVVVTTFASAGITWNPANEDCSTYPLAAVEYKRAGGTNWHNAQALWCDDRAGTNPTFNEEFRGSIVGLAPGTKYHLRLTLTGDGETATTNFTTMSETFPTVGAADVTLSSNVEGTAGGNPYAVLLNTSGTSSDYYVYDCDGYTVDGNGYKNYGIEVEDDTGYIIIRNCTVTDTLIHGILLNTGSHHIVIEDNTITNWGFPHDGQTQCENADSGGHSDSFTTSDVSTGAETINFSGFSDGEIVEFQTSGTLPSPLALHTAYYVKGGSPPQQISATSGGAAINLTTVGSGTSYATSAVCNFQMGIAAGTNQTGGLGPYSTEGADEAGHHYVIQYNTIGPPAGDSNDWETPVSSTHPRGQQAIGFSDSTGYNIIRYNTMSGDDTHWFNDGIGWGTNDGMKMYHVTDAEVSVADDTLEVTGLLPLPTSLSVADPILFQCDTGDATPPGGLECGGSYWFEDSYESDCSGACPKIRLSSTRQLAIANTAINITSTGSGGFSLIYRQGFPGANTDIYGNIIKYTRDNAIENDGGGENVRVWENYIDHGNDTISTTNNGLGPSYAFRNVFNQIAYGRDGSTDPDSGSRGTTFKTGRVDSPDRAPFYVYHNVTLQPDIGETKTGGTTSFLVSTNNEFKNVTAYNNIAHVVSVGSNWPGYHIYDDRNSTSGQCSNDIDYNLYNGSLERYCTSPLAEDDGGINGTPTYGGTTFTDGDTVFAMSVGSGENGHDTGISIPNFNDGEEGSGYEGSGPDMGAVEYGTAGFCFGITCN